MENPSIRLKRHMHANEHIRPNRNHQQQKMAASCSITTTTVTYAVASSSIVEGASAYTHASAVFSEQFSIFRTNNDVRTKLKTTWKYCSCETNRRKKSSKMPLELWWAYKVAFLFYRENGKGYEYCWTDKFWNSVHHNWTLAVFCRWCEIDSSFVSMATQFINDFSRFANGTIL